MSMLTQRMIAISPSTRGFGYAVFEGLDTFIDWGTKETPQPKSFVCLNKVRKLIIFHQPEVLVLEDFETQGCRRSRRLKDLCFEIQMLALVELGIGVSKCTSRDVARALLRTDKATKYEIAKAVCDSFAGETEVLLPPKRRPWECDDLRMEVIRAMALIATHRLLKKKPKREISRLGGE